MKAVRIGLELDRGKQWIGRARLQQGLKLTRKTLGAARRKRDALRGERRLDRLFAPLFR